MAEAGPSSANGSSPAYRNARLPFPPLDQEIATRLRLGKPLDSSSRTPSFGMGHPPRSVSGSSGGRRRVRSVGEGSVPSAGAKRRQGDDAPRRVFSNASRMGSMRFRNLVPAQTTDTSNDFSVPFSDEYDLSHEDPRILEDVQRALDLRAKREARLKALQSNDRSLVSDQASSSSFSTHASSPVRARISIPDVSGPTTHIHASGPQGGSMESEIDFSPSVGAIPHHPVPSSSNNGATLDWTGSGSEDERDGKRWSLSLAKRKHKDKFPYYANKAVVEKQESVYAEKLALIRAKAKPHTLRKAAITGDQLKRRYVLLGDSNTPVTILSAARWYSQRESVVQASLDNAEPLTWLKHLLDKHGGKPSVRLPWHITALILEEYARSVGIGNTRVLQSIPEDSTVNTTEPTAVDSLGSPLVEPHFSPQSPHSKAPSKSPSTDSWSYTPPISSLEPSISRRRRPSSPYEEGVSFEPQVDSGRSSVGADSRRSSLEPYHPLRGYSLPYTDSTRSSLVGSGSRRHFRDFVASRISKKVYQRSEEGLSSARNSISEHSHEEEARPPNTRKSKGRMRHLSLPQPPKSGIPSEEEGGAHSASEPGQSSGADGPKTAKQTSPSVPFEGTPTFAIDAPVSRNPSPEPRPLKPPRLGRRRMSLPSLNQLLTREQEKRQAHADEEEERREYERKRQLLDDAFSQNQRTRQLLQRVSGNIREYENVQLRLSELLGAPHHPIPPEVLDAMSHDPAAILNGTRRLTGWRAVDDISERVQRQRDTLQRFAQAMATMSDGGRTGIVGSMFEGHCATVSGSLKQLEHHRERIAQEAEDVLRVLASVKEVHSSVKREYNDVMAHTSLLYPQISQIVALEESYRNKYQQFWDIALDLLTLLLDTVTPFWRIYGKVIGEDVQDFLIVPWYRNEFTGEQKRYPLTRLPRRSFKHWIGLLLFAATSVGSTSLFFRLTLSWTSNYSLPWISHTGLRYLLTPIFLVLLLVFWSFVLLLFLMVLAQVGVVIWWLGWAVKIFN